MKPFLAFIKTLLAGQRSAVAASNTPPTAVNIAMPPVGAHPQDTAWEAMIARQGVGSIVQYLGREMVVTACVRYAPGYYPYALPSLPPRLAGYQLEYVDNHGVIREHFMPARVAMATIPQYASKAKEAA